MEDSSQDLSQTSPAKKPRKIGSAQTSSHASQASSPSKVSSSHGSAASSPAKLGKQSTSLSAISEVNLPCTDKPPPRSRPMRVCLYAMIICAVLSFSRQKLTDLQAIWLSRMLELRNLQNPRSPSSINTAHINATKNPFRFIACIDIIWIH